MFYSDIEANTVTLINTTLNWDGRLLAYAFMNSHSTKIYLVAGAYDGFLATRSVVAFDAQTYDITLDSHLRRPFAGNRSRYAGVQFENTIYIIGGLNRTGGAITSIQFANLDILPSMAPTSQPTFQPTTVPTNRPTNTQIEITDPPTKSPVETTTSTLLDSNNTFSSSWVKLYSLL